MSSDVQIKQFEIADYDALLSFLRIAFPSEPLKSDPAFWRWHFRENPLVSPDDTPLWIAKSGDKIVGQVASIPVELKVGQENRRAAWLVDYILLPEYRPGGLGIFLFRAGGDDCDTLLSLGYNQNSAAVMRFLKWQPLGNIHRYHVLLFPGHATAEIARMGPVRHLVNLLYAPYRAGLRTRAPTGGGYLREVTTCDAAFDQLWSEAASQWPCAVVRNARLLEWQFLRQPGKKYDVLGYYNHNRLAGYIVLFFRKPGPGGAPPKAAISDLCYGPNNSAEVIDNLLRGALRLALERKAGSLVMDILDERVEARLGRFGFRRIKASPLFAAKTATQPDLIYERSNWFLTRGDSDVSIFEESNL